MSGRRAVYSASALPRQPRGRHALVAAERPRVLACDGHVFRLWPGAGDAPPCLQVRFWDGAELVAAPQDTEEYRATAAALGYRGPAAAADMALQHDVLHVVCAQWLGARTSPVVYAMATGTLDALERWAIDGEEALVAAFARYLQTGYRDPWLAPLSVAHGPDFLEQARRHLVALFGPPPTAQRAVSATVGVKDTRQGEDRP